MRGDKEGEWGKGEELRGFLDQSGSSMAMRGNGESIREFLSHISPWQSAKGIGKVYLPKSQRITKL
jgi:hypothetical protein